MSNQQAFNDAREVGTRIGDVVLGKAIGQGGEGIIYLAQHDELGEVAVKEYFPKTMASRLPGGDVAASTLDLKIKFKEGIGKFIESGEQIISLPKHPNILTCHEVFEAGKTAFLVMQYVKGPTLKEVLAQQDGYGNVFFVLDLARQLISALTFLHARTIRHRDIAPANIVMEAHSGKAVLIDFSMAKLIVAKATMSAQAMYTPGYSPIEQLDAGQPAPTLDIYAASAVLYHTIAGQAPQDATNRSHGDKYRKLTSMPIRGYPQSFLEAIDHGLERLAKNRPQTVAIWQNELFANVVDSGPSQTRSDASASRKTSTPKAPAPPRPIASVKLEKVPVQTAKSAESTDDGSTLGCIILAAIVAAIIWAIYHFWWAAPYADMTQEQMIEAVRGHSNAQLLADCNAGKPESCTQLGFHTFRGEQGLKKDFVGAKRLFENACNADFMPACTEMGHHYRNGMGGIAKDPSTSVKLYSKSCDGHYAGGCGALGAYYQLGPENVRDEARGAELLELACEGDDMIGCSLLGEAYSQGRGVSSDKEEAVALFQKACDSGVSRACTSLGTAYARGDGVDIDQIKAANAYMLSCEKDNPRGCYGLAWSYQTGKGRSANPKEAVRLYTQSCDRGLTEGCTGLALMLRMTGDYDRSVELLTQSCSKGDYRACNGLAESHERELGLKRDLELEAKLFAYACNGPFIALACYKTGLRKAEKGDLKGAERLFDGACRRGIKEACDRLPEPGARLKGTLSEIGCNIGIESSCTDATAKPK